ncbi:MAG: c-type cytochrome [Burkholderiales bacterium]
MTRLVALVVAVSAAAACALSGAAAAADAVRGQKLYQSRCSACHSLDRNRVGPRHRGVFGRRAGSLPDYDYSPALRRSRIVWNEQSLDRWLANPQALIPGQRMNYSVPDERDRADLIAYLKSVR